MQAQNQSRGAPGRRSAEPDLSTEDELDTTGDGAGVRATGKIRKKSAERKAKEETKSEHAQRNEERKWTARERRGDGEKKQRKVCVSTRDGEWW